MNPLDIGQLKERFSIPEAWRVLGLNGEPGHTCHSPFREDSKPSFSVYAEGRKWKDFGEGTGGDVVDFIARGLDIDTRGAVRWMREQLGEPVSLPRNTSTPRSESRIPTPWPTLHVPTDAEFSAITRTRGVSGDALRLVAAEGFLACGQWHGVPFWSLSDSRRELVELRRLDGLPWAAYGTLPERKAHCMGRGKAWPIGIAESGPFETVCLVEGAPDFLAVHHLALLEGKVRNACAIALLGGANRMAPEAAALLAGKRVMLYPHADEAGQRAALEWTRTLLDAGAEVIGAFDLGGMVKLDGSTGKDLNDLCFLHPDCLLADVKWREVMP